MNSIRLFSSFSRIAVSRNHRSFSASSAMEKKRVFITREIPASGMEILKASKDIQIDQWKSEELVPRDLFLEKIKDSHGVLCVLDDDLSKDVLSQAKNLSVISTMSVGYNHIDVKECQERNIAIGYTPGVLTGATADLTLTLILATLRRIPEAVDGVKQGVWSNWKPTWLCGRDLDNATVGLIGLGRIGVAVGKRLKGFGCRILYTGRREKPEEAKEIGAEFVDFDTLLRESDVVSPHCPLNAETKNLFNAEAFKKMKNTAVFVNTTRGGVVDQDALYDALKNNEIWAAGLDVTVPEPLPTDHKLLTLSNCVIFPHIGSATLSCRSTMAEIAARNLVLGLEKKPLLHQVTL